MAEGGARLLRPTRSATVQMGVGPPLLHTILRSCRSFRRRSRTFAHNGRTSRGGASQALLRRPGGCRADSGTCASLPESRMSGWDQRATGGRGARRRSPCHDASSAGVTGGPRWLPPGTVETGSQTSLVGSLTTCPHERHEMVAWLRSTERLSHRGQFIASALAFRDRSTRREVLLRRFDLSIGHVSRSSSETGCRRGPQPGDRLKVPRRRTLVSR